MKSGFSVFLAAFVALGASWFGFVLAPILQLGTAKQTTVLNSSDIYPNQRPGDATLGLQVYRANGCVACHTEQIQQDGVACDVVLTSIGTNKPSEFKAYMFSLYELPGLQVQSNNVSRSLRGWSGKLPKTLLQGVDKTAADSLLEKLAAAGLKAEIDIVATGLDITPRGWGIRRSVAEDFLWDYPVQLGSIRIGPDLADVGARLDNANWQLLHLYAPQSLVKNSGMPPFRFLFRTQKIGGEPSPDALVFPQGFMSAPLAGYEVVPKPEAKQLVAYLLSLRADVPLYEAPFTPPQISTNAPVK
jgi:hypothetical protein